MQPAHITIAEQCNTEVNCISNFFVVYNVQAKKFSSCVHIMVCITVHDKRQVDYFVFESILKRQCR